MKKLFFLVLIFFTTIGYSQNYWTSEVDINFLVSSNTKVASFVDNNGIHIVYSRNGGIRYALVNSNGGVIKYDKVIESEGNGTNYANVVAFNDYVYAIYYKNNDIKVAKSTNLGSNWNSSFSSFDLINTGCNKILAYKYDEFIYIVWSEVRVSGYGYDSHFIKFTPSTTSWSEYKNVSDNETYGGDEPDLTFSSNRVHVSFIKYDFDEPKTRDRSSGTWQTSQSVPFDYLPYTTNLRKGKPIIANNWLNEIYRADYASIGVEGSYIGHSYRSIGGSTWTQNEVNLYTPVDKVHVVNNTLNDRIHIIYYDEQEENYVHKYLSGDTYSDVIATVPLYEQSSFLSSNSNDLYLLRVNNPDTPSKIKFRHYDDDPLTPPNFAGQIYGNHPKLTWIKIEPDIAHFEIWWQIVYDIKHPGSWNLLTTTTNTSFIDYGVELGGTTVGWVNYMVRSKDIGGNYSSYTTGVSFAFSGFNKVVGENRPLKYSLNNNYPNPFNPSTQIKYSLARDADVTLKVYDMLGTEVAKLVNETQVLGSYEINFNAGNLSSGVYIYRITASNNGRILFTDSKQMILLR